MVDLHFEDSSDFKIFLDEKVAFFNSPTFIESDPIAIPHQFINKYDREISGFITATIAWGNRKSILKSGNKFMSYMDFSPYDFILNHSVSELKALENYVHRTFNGADALFFVESLKNIYKNHGGLENVFSKGFQQTETIFGAINHFRDVFFEVEHLQRSQKHISSPAGGSAAKRLNMFLRWMVRDDKNGVDFGLWKSIPLSKLMIPLDVHSGRMARKFHLLNRKANDWRAVEELTQNLRKLCPTDPIKYDFALFGMGAQGESF
ncbi:MAG: TIGR02757 family protein [Bacteroidales bacterium]|nr:TIGR02757 family protein [Bacteroidales bacterium]